MLFKKNYAFLIDAIGVPQKQMSIETGIPTSTLSRLRTTGSTPRPSTLTKLARFFSKHLNIPYDVFDNGQALLTKDFTMERNLRINRENNGKASEAFGSPDENHPLVPKLTDSEKAFVIRLREIYVDRYEPIKGETISEFLQCARIFSARPHAMKRLIELMGDFGYGKGEPVP